MKDQNLIKIAYVIAAVMTGVSLYRIDWISIWGFTSIFILIYLHLTLNKNP